MARYHLPRPIWIILICAVLHWLPAQDECLAAAARGDGDERAGSPVGRIAFVRNDEIWTVRPDGSGERRLASGRGVYPGVAWSPTGDRIAWTDHNGLWVLDVRTLERTRVRLPTTKTEYGQRQIGPWGLPAWAPSGGWLFVGGFIAREVDADGGLWQLSPRNDAPPQMLLPPVDADSTMYSEPAVSPNGRYILAGGALTGYGWLGIYDAVSRRLTVRLRPRHLVDHFAAYEWLADSRTVLLSCDTEKYDWQSHRGPGGIWKWDIISGAAKEWLETGTPISCVEVSPDASRIAYLVPAEDSSLSKLRVHEIVSGSTSTVWQGIHYAHLGDFSWAPDSKRIALSEDTWEDGAAALWVIDVVERTQRIILENATAPAWSPR